LKHLELLRICKVCSSGFEPKKEGQTCCSKKCYSYMWRKDNLEHRNNYKKEYYRNGNPQYKEYCDKKSTLWMYKMSIEQFNALLENQGGHCALCPNRHCDNGYRLHVDHDHNCCNTRGRQSACGKCNRGLLCNKCNSSLAVLERALLQAKTVEALDGTWLHDALLYINRYKVKI
jgi:Recombination endonuclease VII